MKTLIFRSFAVRALFISGLFMIASCSQDTNLVPTLAHQEKGIAFRTSPEEYVDEVKAWIADWRQVPLDNVISCVFVQYLADGRLKYNYQILNGPFGYVYWDVIGYDVEGF